MEIRVGRERRVSKGDDETGAYDAKQSFVHRPTHICQTFGDATRIATLHEDQIGREDVTCLGPQLGNKPVNSSLQERLARFRQFTSVLPTFIQVGVFLT